MTKVRAAITDEEGGCNDAPNKKGTLYRTDYPETIRHPGKLKLMSLGVLNNLSAVYAENNLNKTSASLQTSLEQLSSGSRINSGADDAAGLSLVNSLGANSAALTQSETNSTEGVGVLQVADGALSQVTSLLDRAITLATEASNGTLNTSQEKAADQEYQSILAEINSIGSTTTYNGNQIFTGSTDDVYTGDSSSQGGAIDSLYFAKLSSSSLGDSGGTVVQSNTGEFLDLSTDAKATLTDGSSKYVLDTAATVNDVTSGTISFTVTTSTGGSSIYYTTDGEKLSTLISEINDMKLPGISASLATAEDADVSSSTISSSDVGLQITNTNSDVSISINSLADTTTNATTTEIDNTSATTTIGYEFASGGDTTVDLSSTDLSSASDAQTALQSINSAISTVAAQDGYIGAQINMLEAINTVMSTQQENVLSAQNAVQATDYATATSNMSKYEVLTETGIAALAQANSVQQEVTKLLQ
jgi:flagellin